MKKILIILILIFSVIVGYQIFLSNKVSVLPFLQPKSTKPKAPTSLNTIIDDILTPGDLLIFKEDVYIKPNSFKTIVKFDKLYFTLHYQPDEKDRTIVAGTALTVVEIRPKLISTKTGRCTTNHETFINAVTENGTILNITTSTFAAGVSEKPTVGEFELLFRVEKTGPIKFK